MAIKTLNQFYNNFRLKDKQAQFVKMQQSKALVIEQQITNTLKLQLNYIEWTLVILTFYFIAITTRYLVFVIWNIIKSLCPQTDLLKRYSKNQGQTWAVVTGATDGIGLGFCEQLVSKGFNVCVISRNSQKIKKVIQKLQGQRPAHFKDKKIKGIQFDFTQVQNQDKFNNLWSQIQKLDIGVFVNNVGIVFIKLFEQAEYKQIVDLINVNCITMACLNSKIIAKMKQRNVKSAIINLSSLSGINPIPFISLYSSSKAFNRFISQGVSIQYPQLDILSITPMHVQSGGAKVKKQFNIPTSRQCARDSLKQLQFGQCASNGFFMHRITGEAIMTFLPKRLLRIVSKIQMKKLFTTVYHKKL